MLIAKFFSYSFANNDLDSLPVSPPPPISPTPPSASSGFLTYMALLSSIYVHFSQIAKFVILKMVNLRMVVPK